MAEAVVSTVSRKLAGDSYLSSYRGPTSLLFGAPASYWGSNAKEKEGKEQIQESFVFELFLFQQLIYTTSTSYDALLGESPNDKNNIYLLIFDTAVPPFHLMST